MRAIPLLVLTVALLPAAEKLRQPFTPWRRAWHDPLKESLEAFAYKVLHPGDTLGARRARIAKAREGLARLEAGEEGAVKTDPAQRFFVNLALGYHDRHDVPLDETRDLLLANRALVERRLLAERGLDPSQDRARRVYLDLLAHGKVDGLERLARDPGSALADHALVSVARLRIKAGEFELAARLLDEVEKDHPDSPKQDEVAYLKACRDLWPTFANAYRERVWGPGGVREKVFPAAIADPLGASASLSGYLVDRPEGRWRHRAKAWKAHLRYRYPDQDWGPGGGHAQAARIYEELLLLEDHGGMFHELVASLGMVWPKLKDDDLPRGRVRLKLIHARCGLAADGKADMLFFGAFGLLEEVTQTKDHHLVACLVQLLVLEGSNQFAARVIEKLPKDASPFTTYLYGRLLASTDQVGAAAKAQARLALAGSDGLTRDLAIRIGGACERQGRWAEALTWYQRAGDEDNLAICYGGEMPLDELLAWLATKPVLMVKARVRWGPVQEVDLLPAIRRVAAGRLVAEGRFEEAGKLELPRAFRDELEVLAGLDAKAESGVPADIYALAARWYHRGQAVLTPDRRWGKHHFFRWPPEELGGDAVDPAVAKRWREREQQLLAANAKAKALPLFVRVARQEADPELAAKALYSAALCCWWLSGSNRQLHEQGPWQRSYWGYLNRHGATMAKGDAFMGELVERYPDHALAKTIWARNAVHRLKGEPEEPVPRPKPKALWPPLPPRPAPGGKPDAGGRVEPEGPATR